MAENAPTYMLTAGKSGSDITVRIFSTSRLMDESASGIITTTGAGAISNAILNNDKSMLSFTYTPVDGESLVAFTLAGHYGASNTLAQQSWTLDLSVMGSNQGLVSVFSGGAVFMGGGDASNIYVEPGAIEDENADGKTVIDVNKSEGSVLANSESYGKKNIKGRLIAPEAAAALPTWATATSRTYSFELGGDTVADGKTVTVTLQYDEGTPISSLNILHYVDGAWRVEQTNKAINTLNRTISASVSSLSPFVVATGTAPAGTPGTEPPADTPTDTPVDSGSGGGGGGGCFIQTAGSGNLFGLLLIGLMALPAITLRKKQ
jgi:hypothetical protein